MNILIRIATWIMFRILPAKDRGVVLDDEDRTEAVMAYPPKRGSFAVHKTPGVVSIRGKQKPGYVVVSTWMPPSSDSTYHIQMVWTKSGQFPVGYEVLTTRGRVVGGLFSKASAAVAAAKRDALDTFKNPASVIPRTWIPARVRRLKSGQVQVAVGGRGRR